MGESYETLFNLDTCLVTKHDTTCTDLQLLTGVLFPSSRAAGWQAPVGVAAGIRLAGTNHGARGHKDSHRRELNSRPCAY